MLFRMLVLLSAIFKHYYMLLSHTDGLMYCSVLCSVVLWLFFLYLPRDNRCKLAASKLVQLLLIVPIKINNKIIIILKKDEDNVIYHKEHEVCL